MGAQATLSAGRRRPGRRLGHRSAGTRSSPPRANGAEVHHLACAGDDDRGIGRLPGIGAGDRRPRARLRLPLRPTAFVFLVPVSLVAAELASGWPGGVYNWVREGISAPMGLLAVWCEFAQTIFYYPALLAYVGSTLAYVIDQRLASNGVYTAAIIIVLFWGGVLRVLTGRLARGRALLERDRDRDADPGRDPRRPRRHLPGAGQPLGGTDGRSSHPAGVEWTGQHRPDRQQLLHLRRSRDQRRARRRASQPRRGTIRSRSSSRWRSCWRSSSSRRWRSRG